MKTRRGAVLWYAFAMKILTITAGFLLTGAVVAAEQQWQLGADTWSRPRDGRAVAQMEPLAKAVSHWSQDTAGHLIIRYPGGEEGLLWAHELRSWLVALGVPSQKLELLAGSQQADRIELELSR